MKRLTAPRTKSAQGGSSRRHFLAMIGTAGLGASATVFGTATPAAAASCRCCRLNYCPTNMTWSYCRNGIDYTWYCTTCVSGTCYSCGCCEAYTASGREIGSAISCREID